MIHYKRTLFMSKKEHEEAIATLKEDLGGEDEMHTLTATFPDGREMDIVGICNGDCDNSCVEPILYEYVGDGDGWEAIASGNNGFSQSYEGTWMLHDWYAEEPIEYEVEVKIV